MDSKLFVRDYRFCRSVNGCSIKSVMFNFLHTNPTVTIHIDSDDEIERKSREFTNIEGPFHSGKGKLTGSLSIEPPPGKVVSHRGIELELFGEFRTDKNSPLGRFFTRKQFLEPAGDLARELKTDFTFDGLNLPTSTYFGTATNVVYAVRVRVVHRISDFVVEKPFNVIQFEPFPEQTIQHKEVGIRNILHVEFVFPKGFYNCNECVTGAAYFILVKLRIVFMSMTLNRTEIYDSGDTMIKKRTVLKEYEIMDGAPCRGDHIPIRIYMGETGFWPFQNFKGSPLKVEHYLRAMMVDENGKQYFKRMKLEFGRYDRPKIQEMEDDDE